jgi:uncharacterized membrane protein
LVEVAQKALVTDELLLVRIGFIFSGGFMLAEGLQNWIRGRIETHPEVIVLLLITYAAAFVLFTLATLNSTTVLKLRDAALLSLLFLLIASWYVITQVEYPQSYQTDALAFAHYSAILYSKGMNPYTQDLQNALAMFSVNPRFVTLTPTGDVVTILNYPALQFLVFLPIVWMGLPDARWVILVFEIAAILVLYYWSPREMRVLALLPIFAGSDLAISFGAGAIADFLWVLPLMLMVVYMDRPWLAGVMYGLASGLKQTPWLLAPFLLMWFFRTGSDLKTIDRLKRTGIFAAFALGAFLLPNIGFMWNDFGAWYTGVVTPAAGNLVVLGQGLSLMTLAGGVPLPPAFYLVATAIIAIVLIVNYVVYFEKLQYALWAFPAILLWFSYRGLQNYFIFWVPLLVMSAVLLYRREKRIVRD